MVMQTAFLRHHHSRAKRGEITNSIRNCHVHGLHSIMLHDEPGNRIRMFYCDESHELWKNNSTNGNLSLAYHTHHCDVSLIRVKGHAYNHVVVPFDRNAHIALNTIYLKAHKYTSGLIGATGSLEYLAYSQAIVPIYDGQIKSQFMEANKLHTVYVPINEQAAWLVIEGKEDPNYDSTCYTNNSVFDPSNMYTTDPSVALEAFDWIDP